MKASLTTIVFASVMAISISASDKSAGIGPSFKGPIGLQLYSLRADFTRNVPTTLEKVKSFGIKYVETAGTYGLSAAKFSEMLKANGLEAVSGHFPYERYRDELDAVVQDAKTL